MIHLEPLDEKDLGNVMTWVNDRTVMQYFANRQTDVTREEELQYIQRLRASSTDRAYSIYNQEYDEEARYVGQCSLNQIYWPARNARLFIVIRSGEQRHGYGNAAIQALLGKAWSELRLHKVWLIVREDNRAAQAKYLKLGFSFEGLLRDEYQVGDRFYNMVRMGILNPNEVKT